MTRYAREHTLQQVASQTWTPVAPSEVLTPAAVTALSVPEGAGAVMLQAQGGAIRWRDDGVDPVAGGPGMLLADGNDLFYTGDLAGLRVIQDAGAGSLFAAYYGGRG